MTQFSIDPRDPLPRYYQVYSSLQDRIRGGEFHPGDTLPSERQLVKDYGVSRITIVKALDLLVRDHMIDRQQGRGSFVTSCKEPDTGGSICRVAFCMPTYADAYVTSVLIGAARVAMHEGVQLEIIGVESEERESLRIRDAMDDGVGGVLLFPRSRFADMGLFREMQHQGLSLVLLDRYYRELDTDRVVFDDVGAGYALTKALIERGHRRIAIFPGHEVKISSVRGRIRGYQRALEDAELVYDEDLVCLDVYETLSPATLNESESSHLRLFDRLRRDEITAMIAINQIVAMQMNFDLMKIRNELMRAVIEGRGGDVEGPGVEIAAISSRLLAGDHASLVVMALQSGETLGEQGMNVLVRRLVTGSDLNPQRIVIPMEIVPLA
jgi:GntR family transcriptional regulator, arabinose operon transcriptional repressor